jgi:hypothetical protein
MQTLTFNTTTKQVYLLSAARGESTVLVSFDNVSTVKCSDLGFYEIMRKTSEDSTSAIPVLRVPIANTNMIIEK